MYAYAANNPVHYIDPDGRNADYEINDDNHTVTINVNITTYGESAPEEIAKIYENGINNTWAGNWTTTIDGENYSVQINANVRVGTAPENPSPDSSMNYIYVDGSTEVSGIGDSYLGIWRSKGRLGRLLEEDTPAPHEI